MTDRPAMTINDYVIDESCDREIQNNLLDEDGQPNHKLTESREIALAEFASLVHLKARNLNSEQIEQVIKWLKTWKLRNKQYSRNLDSKNTKTFDEILETIKTSKEQITLEKRAYRKTLWARLWIIAFAIFAMISISLIFLKTDTAWYWTVITIAISFGLFGLSDILQEEAIKLYKEQEQKNLWESIRKAETVEELRDAGLFAYLPNTLFEPLKHFNQDVALDNMKSEKERLSDALYRDPSAFLT